MSGSLRRRLARPLFYLVTLAVIAWSVVVTPLPYVEMVPGRPTAIPPMITIAGADTTPIEGETTLLTVFLRDVTPWHYTAALLDPRREARPALEVTHGRILDEEYFRQERERFAEQFKVAAAVGARAAGADVDLRTSVLVAAVLDHGPAAGVLRPGDEILAYDDEPIISGQQLQQRTRAGAPGDQVAVAVRREDAHLDLEIELAILTETQATGIGILVETVAEGLDLPFEVTLADTRIGGPSAGMMMALTVYDLLAEEDLVAGRVIAGTGSIDAEGRIGPVGGVREKALAATRYGVDLLLVPSAQVGEARTHAPPDLTIVPVDTFDEVLAWLRRTDA